MRLPRAAALALVALTGCAQVQTGPGWLLMLPPLSADGYADKTAPFSKWQTYGTYAGRADCNAQISTFQFAVNAQVGQISHAATPSEAEAVQMMSAECIASDDPLLRESNTPRRSP